MKNIIEKSNIEDLIYEIRGKQVILASDLAKIYHCSNGTKDVNKAVKRNIDRFPDDFCFSLTDEESKNIWFQIGTKNNQKETRGGSFKNPRVFTEEGVAMLSGILNTDVAKQVSVDIMRAFVKMRKYISSNNEVLINHEKRILKLEDIFDKLNEKEKINTIFFDGQIYDAYSLLIDILNKSKKEIVIIDNYAGKELLDILKSINKKIIIVSSNIDEVLKNKYQKQYNNVTFINNNTFHDRFIIIDKKILYSCGSSFKDLGKKCFAINRIEDKEYLKILLDKISIL